jgi:hypothetical protein
VTAQLDGNDSGGLGPPEFLCLLIPHLGLNF